MKKMRNSALQAKLFEMVKYNSKLQMQLKLTYRENMKKMISVYDNTLEDDELEKLLKNPQ